MKKIIFLVLLLGAVSFSSFASEKGSFQSKTGTLKAIDFQIKKYSTEDKTVKQVIVENKKIWLGAALGFSIASGVIFTSAIIFSSFTGYYYYGTALSITAAYAFSGLTGAFWGLFWAFTAPAAAAFWVLYGLAIKFGKKGKKSGLYIKPSNRPMEMAISFGIG